MEWREFLGEMSLPGRAHMREQYGRTRVPFVPQYVMRLRGWSNRRASRLQAVRDHRRICAMLDELCPDRWVNVGYSTFLFEHRGDAALAKLSWPEDLK